MMNSLLMNDDMAAKAYNSMMCLSNKSFMAQPIIELASNRIYGYELLYRPMDIDCDVSQYFSKLTTQQQIQFDCQLLVATVLELDVTRFKRVTINISPCNAGSEYFIGLLEYINRFHAAKIKHLILEFTERMPMHQLSERLIDELEQFKQAGGKIFLDDFGDGYMHTELIQHGLVDALKITHQKQIPDSEKYYSMIIALARTLGLKVVLEKVDNPSVYALAKRCQFDYMQGHYLN